MIDDVGEKYCSVNEVCLTEVSFVTSTYEVVRVTRRCASKESDDECHAVNAQGNFLNFLYHNKSRLFIVRIKSCVRAGELYLSRGKGNSSNRNVIRKYSFLPPNLAEGQW